MFVHEKVYDQFVAQMTAAVDQMVMGDPLDPKTDIGTIISQSQYDKVQSYIAQGEALPGVKAIHCSQLPSDPQLKNGLFIRPVVFTNIDNDCSVSREEIFGPVCSVIKFSDFDDVIRQANDTEYGLAASIWTQNLKFALQATKRLEAGVVQVNQNIVLNPNFPVGGYKTSGLGREASLESMIETYTKPKLISMNMQ
jgi:acyl-CoA reductase-like NAD-dependent aldehyde dehydrogenase